MREIFYIDDTPANKISYYFLLAFLVTLPFDRMFSELALIGLSIHSLIHPALDRKISGRWAGWLVLSLYLLTMAGTLYTIQRSEAWKDWEKELALLLFPLICYFTRLDLRKVRLPLLKGFALTCLFTVLYLYGDALYTIHDMHLPLTVLFSPSFTNHRFSLPIDLHATYFAMDLALSLVVFAWLFFRAAEDRHPEDRHPGPDSAGSGRARWFYALACLILLAAILQLAARAVCISLVVILNILLPYFLVRGRARRLFLFVSLSLTVISVIFIVRNADLHSRYVVQLSQDLHGATGGVNDPEPRMARWRLAWELVRASPWIGYGTGSEVSMLQEQYLIHHLYNSYAHELNAHNQYLSFLLQTGFIGCLFYLIVLGVGLTQAFGGKDVFLASFLVIIACVSFSENILDVNKGIFFFAFFFSFFLYRPVVQSSPLWEQMTD